MRVAFEYGKNVNVFCLVNKDAYKKLTLGNYKNDINVPDVIECTHYNK
jgi:hypothetical protein